LCSSSMHISVSLKESVIVSFGSSGSGPLNLDILEIS